MLVKWIKAAKPFFNLGARQPAMTEAISSQIVLLQQFLVPLAARPTDTLKW